MQCRFNCATFNFGSRNIVTNPKKLAKLEEQMVQLLQTNSIACAQESDGIMQTLLEVAKEYQWQHCDEHFEGIMTFWDPKQWELVRPSSQERIWPVGSGEKKDWRRLLVCILRPMASVESPCFAICNNHCHDGSGDHQVGINRTVSKKKNI